MTQIMNQNIDQQLVSHLREERLFQHRTLFLSEAVTSQTAKRFVADLLNLDAESQKPILLYVNSPGGEVNSGFAIYDTIRYISSPVTVVNTGLCASIATIINIAVKKERRLSMPNTRFLIHQPLISGQIYGQASDLEIHANEIIRTRNKINELLAEACEQPLERVAEDTLRDYWMTADESLEYGLISRIVTSQKEFA